MKSTSGPSIIIDPLSLTINGIKFFRCPSEAEMSEALRCSSREIQFGRAWDEAGVIVYNLGELKVVEFALDNRLQFEHRYADDTTKETFAGTITLFGYTIPNNPCVDAFKSGLHCVTLGCAKLLDGQNTDFEYFRVTEAKAAQVSVFRIELWVVRFPPKQAVALRVNFRDNYCLEKQFDLRSTESIISAVGLHCDQIQFVVTNERIIAQKYLGNGETSPVGAWDLSRVEEFRVLPLTPPTWRGDFHRSNYIIKVSDATVQLGGNSCERSGSLPDFEDYDLFFQFLRLAKPDIVCARPIVQTVSDQRAKDTILWSGEPRRLIKILPTYEKYDIQTRGDNNKEHILTITKGYWLWKEQQHFRKDHMRSVKVIIADVLFGTSHIDITFGGSDNNILRLHDLPHADASRARDLLL